MKPKNPPRNHSHETPPELIVVSGKGGVGKSTMAAAIALKKARAGKKTLLVELGDHSYFEKLFSQKSSFQPQSLFPNVDWALWQGALCLQELIKYYIPSTKLVDAFFKSPVMSAFVKAAPALQELSLLGKFTSGLRKHGPQMSYDCLVMDAFATGHFLSLLRVPGGMAQAVALGPMGEQSRKMQEILTDPHRFKIVLVTLMEDLPLQETQELKRTLESEFQQSPQIIFNKNISIKHSKNIFADNTADEMEFILDIQKRMRQQQHATELFPKQNHFVDWSFATSPREMITEISSHLGEL